MTIGVVDVVADFFADRTGANVSTQAFQNALDNGQTILIPPGYYRVGALEVRGLQTPRSFRIFGIGTGTQDTIIEATTDGDLLTVNEQLVEIDHIWFRSLPSRTTGAYIRLNASDCIVHHCRFLDGPVGVTINSTLTKISDCDFAPRAGSGVGIDVLGGYALYVNECRIVAVGPGVPGRHHACIRVWNCADLAIHGGQLLGAGTPLRYEPGGIIASVSAIGVDLGQAWCGLYCGPGTTAVRSAFVGCKFMDCDAHGALIQSGNGWQFSGCQFLDNGSASDHDGLHFDTASDLLLSGCQLAGNTGRGLYLGSGTRGATVVGCTIGKACDFPGNRVGVRVEPGALDVLPMSGVNRVSGNTYQDWEP